MSGLLEGRHGPWVCLFSLLARLSPSHPRSAISPHLAYDDRVIIGGQNILHGCVLIESF